MDHAFYRELLDSLADGVYFVDLERRVTYWNKAAERISGYSEQEILGKSCSDNFLRHVDDCGTQLCIEGCPLRATMSDGMAREANVYMHHKFGHRVPVHVRATPMRGAGGTVIGAVEVFADNSKSIDIIKEIETLRKEVLTDKLTCVGNRRYADFSMENLDRTMAESKVPFGVLFIDIDHFKKVNDTWGHDVGDDVLVMVAKTLDASLRPLDVLCRWGGEEFVVFVPNTNQESLKGLAERLRILVEHSWIDHGDEQIRVTASFGGAVSRQGEEAAAVVARADKQVYLSKEGGRNCTHVDTIC